MYNDGVTIASIARQLNVSSRSVSTWKSIYHKGRLAGRHLKPKNRTDIEYKKLYEEFKELKLEIENIKLEREILKQGSPFLFLKPREKYLFIQQNITIFSIVKMCKMLKIGTAGYYRWLDRPPTKQSKYHETLLEEVKKVYTEHKGRYGSRRITAELQLAGFKTNQVSVCNMMRKMNLKVLGSKRYKVTTNSSHSYPVAQNRLMQKFEVSRPNEVWVSDITHIKIAYQEWLYLTTIIDLFDRKVIGWTLSKTMKAKETTLEAFRVAILNRPLLAIDPLIFHSDRGIQYACKEFTSEIGKHKTVLLSMSAKGNSWDNAVAESFFSTLKKELVHVNRYETREQATASISDYIENYYNKNRRHSALNYLTMIEFQKLIDDRSKNNLL